MTDDPGLQPQRTTLAWTRTGIGAAALTGILARHAAESGSVLDIAATASAGAAVLCLLLLARVRRDRITAAVAAGASPVSTRAVAVTTFLIAVTALCEAMSFLMNPR
jgi:hypothetical protein